MGDNSEIIDIEYGDTPMRGGTDGGSGDAGSGDSGKPTGGLEGSSGNYGCDITITYSWDPSSSFDCTSMRMKLNNSAYIDPLMTSYTAVFSYVTDLSNVTSYNINLFYNVGGQFTTTKVVNYTYNLNQSGTGNQAQD